MTYHSRYSSSLYIKRKRRKRRLIIVILLLTTVFAARSYIRTWGPAWSFGREDNADNFSSPDSSEDSLQQIATVSGAMDKPNLPEMSETSSEINTDPTIFSDEIHLDPMIFSDEITECLNAQPLNLIEARDKLNEKLSVPMSSRQLAFVKNKLTELSEKWLFSRTVLPEDELCSSYKVKLGDRFVAIGKKFNVPYQILMRINNIKTAQSLRAGDTIKVINGPFHCRIYRSSFTMDLYLQDTFVRSFSVGLGKAGMETPTGRWVVKANGKLISPTWTDPLTRKTYEAEDPNYPLGSRWIGLEGIEGAALDRNGFAIHGTRNRQDVGRTSSQGCIRLIDDDVVLVYDLLTPNLSQIEIVD